MKYFKETNKNIILKFIVFILIIFTHYSCSNEIIEDKELRDCIFEELIEERKTSDDDEIKASDFEKNELDKFLQKRYYFLKDEYHYF